MLIIGVGNEMRGDDAAGLVAARAFHALGVSAVESDGDAASLMQLWKNQPEVIVIDATRSGALPGTIHRFDAHLEPLPAAMFGFSTHRVGLPEAVELSRVLGELPAKLIVYGIEGESFEINRTISPRVQVAAEALSYATVISLAR